MADVVTTISYMVHFRYPWDYDDDSPSGMGDHTICWSDSSLQVVATNDEEARLASMDLKFHRPCSTSPRYHNYPTKILKLIHEETADGFVRDTETEVPLPQSGHCPCGKVFWPICGETACHELVPLEEDHA